MEKPSAYIPTSVPSSAAGTTSVGIRVARKFCRNTSITRNTSVAASASVIITSRMATLMKVVESNAQNQLTPAGKLVLGVRSEEHTSELQSRSDLVCRLLLEKKKKKKI